ncbi:uncharacterized protein LOC129796875 [Lutzomyia longipalpis]|uniref:uncharacterized protein LOC129796875 n=1 Tax=Lutzomyia longipalpis TaxID=7200 RepID=UPI002483AA97|nr:uncharacterized protein LOC129796875 [Lutzomyia longipalpis]
MPPSEATQSEKQSNSNINLTRSTLGLNTRVVSSSNLGSNDNDNDTARQLVDNIKSIDLGAGHEDAAAARKAIKRNSASLISFKSLDINLKSIYAGFRAKNSSGEGSRGGGSGSSTAPSSGSSIRRTPYLKIEAVDKDEAESLLTYCQSPGMNRSHRGSVDRSPGFLNIHADQQSQSQSSSPYLSISPPHIRRSSTSDIIDKKPPGTDSRRPSTSSLLRKARERKGSECGARMGRSISQGGLTRGGKRGGRRTSMVF